MGGENTVIPENNPLENPENINVKSATIELTHNNNLYNLMTPIEKPVKESLNTQGWIQVIDKLNLAGVEKITLTGGEPTVRNDFYDILGYAINTIGDVTVQTNGTTSTKLSSYRCTVAIELLDVNSQYHNQIMRETDPREYRYDKKRNRLIKTEGGNCMYCKKEVANNNGCRLHLKSEHKNRVITDLNDKIGLDIGSWEEAKEEIHANEDLGFEFFLTKQYDLSDRENAFTKAFEKAENVDRPTIIKSSVFENNDVKGIMSMAESLQASTVFTPLKPVGRARKNFFDQVPSPGRMKDVMQAVNAFDSILRSNHTIDTPLYRAYRWKKERQMLGKAGNRYELEQKYDLESKMEKYWKRGRLDDTGVSLINILPNGNVTPSHHLRDRDLGNLVKDSMKKVEEEMAKWNKDIYQEKFHRSAESTDLRAKNIASDLGMVLNNPYKKP